MGLRTCHPPTRDALERRGLGTAIFAMFGGAKEIGTEFYAPDYRCARGYKKKPLLLPGKRWWYKPAYGVIPVATPCPCALGPWTGLQAGSERKPPKHYVADEFGAHWDIHVPRWQRLRGTMLADGPSGSEGSVTKDFLLAVAQPPPDSAQQDGATATRSSKLRCRRRLRCARFASSDFL